MAIRRVLGGGVDPTKTWLCKPFAWHQRWWYGKKMPLDLTTLDEIRARDYIRHGHGYWNITYKCTCHGQEVAYMDYSIFTGQVGSLFIVNPHYTGYGLGSQMLRRAVREMKEAKLATEVWAVTRDDHPYWLQLWKFQPRRPVHPSVTASGFFMRLEDIPL